MSAPIQRATSRLTSRIDVIAIGLGLALAALVRFNILPSIPF